MDTWHEAGVSAEKPTSCNTGDLDRLLAPIERHFGKTKCREVADFCISKRDWTGGRPRERTADPALRADGLRK
jgi:hypothetical protein